MDNNIDCSRMGLHWRKIKWKFLPNRKYSQRLNNDNVLSSLYILVNAFWLCYFSWGTIHRDLYRCVVFYCFICLSLSTVIALSPVLTSTAIRKMSPRCWVWSFPSADLSISVSPSYLISCSLQTFPYSVIDLTLKNLLCILGSLLNPDLSTSLTSHFLSLFSLYLAMPLFNTPQRVKWERVSL